MLRRPVARDVDAVVLDLADGGDARERKEEADAVGKARIVGRDGLTGREVLGFEDQAVCREDELGLGSGGPGAGLQASIAARVVPGGQTAM